MGKIKIDGYDFETDADGVIKAQVKKVVPLKHYEILGTGPGNLIETAHRSGERYVEMLVTDEVGIEYIVSTQDYVVHRIQYGERDDLRGKTFDQIADQSNFEIGSKFWWETK